MRAPTIAAALVATLSTLAAAGAHADAGFVTADRLDATSRIGAEIGYLVLDGGAPGTDASGLRFDVHGHFFDQASRFGGYAVLPVHKLSIEGPQSDRVSALGDIEIGGMYMPEVGNFDLVLRGGITLPTAGETLEGVLTSILVTNSRITDTVLAIPEGVTLRFAASPIFQRGKAVIRADLGLDLNIDQAGGAEADPLIRLNLAAAYHLPKIAFIGELINLIFTGDDAQSLHQLSVGLSGVSGSLRPYGAISFPLSETARTPLAPLSPIEVKMAITAGLEFDIR